MDQRREQDQGSLTNVLSIFLSHPDRFVQVWVDWQDYGDTQDGLPVMHYRLQINRLDGKLSDDARATSLVEDSVHNSIRINA